MTKHNLPENEITDAAPECQIISSRVFDMPVEKVFDAWTDHEKLVRWWGPKGFTNTFHQFDLRPGGKWSFIMHGPDKGHYPNECVFIDIVKNENWYGIISQNLNFRSWFILSNSLKKRKLYSGCSSNRQKSVTRSKVSPLRKIRKI
jgi:hypothetical protein